jgi:hypothetical protein
LLCLSPLMLNPLVLVPILLFYWTGASVPQNDGTLSSSHTGRLLWQWGLLDCRSTSSLILMRGLGQTACLMIDRHQGNSPDDCPLLLWVRTRVLAFQRESPRLVGEDLPRDSDYQYQSCGRVVPSRAKLTSCPVCRCRRKRLCIVICHNWPGKVQRASAPSTRASSPSQVLITEGETLKGDDQRVPRFSNAPGRWKIPRRYCCRHWLLGMGL